MTRGRRRATTRARLVLATILSTLPPGAIAWARQVEPVPDYHRTADTIAKLLNAYRAELGLKPVTRSPALDRVAQAHVADLAANHPDQGLDPRGLPCNSHSWSARGRWTAICYTADHAYAGGMWNKPAEITGAAYPSYGYEIAMSSTGPITAERAIAGWKASPGHNSVIAELGVWAGANWRAMGVGAGPGYAVVWFGKEVDATGR